MSDIEQQLFQRRGGHIMLWTIAVILVVLWLLGFLTANTFGGIIHVLLVIALIMILIQVLQGRRS